MSGHSLAANHVASAGATVTMVAHLRGLRSKNILTIAELDLAAEAALLSLHTSFETFVRELYLECITGSTQITGVRSKLRASSAEDAQALVTGDRPFVEWLPLGKTLDRALVHLHGGQPFVRLWQRDQVMRHLNLLHVVRNRVAHSSEQALRKYETQVSRGDAAFHRPARWLLHAPSSKTNFELLADSTTAACQDLSADVRTPILLGPAVVSDGQQGAPGKYRCVTCGRVQHRPTWSPLAPCPQCSTTRTCPSCSEVKRSKSKWRLETLRAVT